MKNILVLCQMPDAVEKARELIDENYLGRGYRSRICRSVSEFEEELKGKWDVIILEKVYENKFPIVTETWYI